MWLCYFFNDPATTGIYPYSHPLSLHDALPIFRRPRLRAAGDHVAVVAGDDRVVTRRAVVVGVVVGIGGRVAGGVHRHGRSEEHTSELQSLMRISYAVFCLKKKTNTTLSYIHE